MGNREVVYLASGSTHPNLAKQVAKEMGVDFHNDDIKVFPSGERYFRFADSIRGKHALLVQSLVSTDAGTVNDSLLELIVMIDAARRGSAKEITVVTPYMAYMRQDRKARGREPISAAAVINSLQMTGAHRLVSIDMHSAQTQAVFDGPFDHLVAEGLIREALAKKINKNYQAYIVVSPDGGRARMAEQYAEMLNVELIHMPKSRSRNNSAEIERPDFINDVSDKHCILIDDMIDTAGTLVSAAETLEKSGAKSVIAAATHGVLSDPARQRLKSPSVTELLLTDTTPLEKFKKDLGNKLTIIPTAPMIAAALTAIIEGRSVSAIFEGRNYL